MVAASERGCRLLIDPPTASGKEPKATNNPHVSARTPRPARPNVQRIIGVGRAITVGRAIGTK